MPAPTTAEKFAACTSYAVALLAPIVGLFIVAA